ncbi:MAG: response regulator transcription factor [Caldilineaceae bacterium]|nr:response regulator transcription factor [Caldilineaceae bacterium]
MCKIEVMLADDHTLVRQGIRSILEMEEDIRVIGEASSGRELLTAIKNGIQPEIILMDIQMPEMDGLEATRQIRYEWPNEEQPYIVAMTANALQGNREEYIKIGMDDYVSKPIKIEELVGALQRCQSPKT